MIFAILKPMVTKVFNPELTFMMENFKGIEFIRISSLPEDQKKKIWESPLKEKIIKIVKDQTLLNDCIMSQDYNSWLKEQAVESPRPAIKAPSQSPVSAFSKLAFK
jgi:hypothetical protein